ncbi:MAG: FadR family transcriptional regulator [Desulfobacterales bacterium]|nr:FadR family transcriptional regulator [Desulfobacterales bacterium]
MTIPIRKVTATEAIVESLKERIRDGEFGPGDQLPSEQSMLGEYGVSRLTLREALARLAALGIIAVQHGKGAFVKSSISAEALDNVLIPMFPQHNVNRMNELVEARNLMESEMAAMVAAKRTPEQIDQLEKLLQFDEAALGSPEAFAERDYAFHLALAQMAGNQFLLAMYQALYSHIRIFLAQYALSIGDRKEALERHRPILEAIAIKDVETARTLAREHARICASYIEKIRHKEKGETP